MSSSRTDVSLVIEGDELYFNGCHYPPLTITAGDLLHLDKFAICHNRLYVSWIPEYCIVGEKIKTNVTWLGHEYSLVCDNQTCSNYDLLHEDDLQDLAIFFACVYTLSLFVESIIITPKHYKTDSIFDVEKSWKLLESHEFWVVNVLWSAEAYEIFDMIGYTASDLSIVPATRHLTGEYTVLFAYVFDFVFILFTAAVLLMIWLHKSGKSLLILPIYQGTLNVLLYNLNTKLKPGWVGINTVELVGCCLGLFGFFSNGWMLHAHVTTGSYTWLSFLCSVFGGAYASIFMLSPLLVGTYLVLDPTMCWLVTGVVAVSVTNMGISYAKGLFH